MIPATKLKIIKKMLIKVKVSSDSKKEEIIKKAEDSFDISVKAKPQRGGANKEVIKALAFYFKIPAAKVRLIKGAKQRNKIFKLLNDRSIGNHGTKKRSKKNS